MKYTEKAWAIRSTHKDGRRPDKLYRGEARPWVFRTKAEALDDIERIRLFVESCAESEEVWRRWSHRPVRVRVTVETE